MSRLVQKLAKGDHPVDIVLRPDRNLKALTECLDRGYVHVKFTDTEGGTELLLRLDKNACKLNGDFERGIGEVRVVGGLTLDYVKVTCVADLDLATFTGKGRLIPI